MKRGILFFFILLCSNFLRADIEILNLSCEKEKGIKFFGDAKIVSTPAYKDKSIFLGKETKSGICIPSVKFPWVNGSLTAYFYTLWEPEKNMGEKMFFEARGEKLSMWISFDGRNLIIDAPHSINVKREEILKQRVYANIQKKWKKGKWNLLSITWNIKKGKLNVKLNEKILKDVNISLKEIENTDEPADLYFGINRSMNFYRNSKEGFNGYIDEIKISKLQKKMEERKIVPTKSNPEDYVQIRNGHFYYKGKRLRLWGVNIMNHHVRNYKGAEITVRRLKDMGFNSVHIWLPKGTFHSPKRKWKNFVEVKKGSQLDLFDYFVYCCKKEGIFVTASLSVRGDLITPDVYDLVERNDIDKERWYDLIKKSGRQFRSLKFVDPSIKEAYILQMRYFLNRVNPYTGKKYAEEETIAFYQLEDEMGFLSWPPGRIDNKDSLFQILIKKEWEKFLKKRYQNTEILEKSWGSLFENESINNMKAIFYPGARFRKTPEKRAADAWEFLYGLTEKFYKEYLLILRSQAPEGIGCNVIPVAVDSAIYTRAGNLFDIYRNSTFLCGTGTYSGGGIRKVGDKYKWVSLVETQPPFPSHSVDASILKVSGKPYCPLAGADILNNPYRALTPFFRGLWACWQDWDGIYTYWWGYFPKDVEIDYENYSKFPLRVVWSENKRGGFDILNDEVSLAIHKLSSNIFRNFLISPSSFPTKFIFGKKFLYSIKAADYYHKLFPFMNKTAFTSGAEIIIDENANIEMKYKGKISEKVPYPLQWENGVKWDWENDYIKIDNRYVKGFAGKPEKEINFSDGIKIKNVNRKFIVFLLSPENKKSITNSSELIFTIVSTSHNSGYKEDFSKIQFNKRWKFPYPWSVVVNPGNFPIVVERVSTSIFLPFSGIVEKYDFNMKKFDEKPFNEVINISENEPLFFGKIIKK